MALDTPPKLAYKRTLGFALETTTGTPAAIAASDCVTLAFGDVPFIHYATEKVEREQYGPYGSPIIQYLGARSATANFEIELNSGQTGGPIWATRLLAACGMTNTGGTWTPLSDPSATVTIAENIDGRQRIMSGAMGTWSLVARRGQKARMRFSFTGIQQPPTDTALPTPTLITTKAPRVGAATFTLGGTSTYKVPEVTIAMNNQVMLREDITAADTASSPVGFRAAYITGRRPTITMSPESVSLATHNFWSDFQNLVTAAFALTIGSAANNTFAFSAPDLQIDQDPELAERQRMLVDGLTFLCTRNAGDDEIQLVLS